MIDTFKQCGVPHNRDFNGETQLGVGFFQTTTKGGERCSSAKAFLTPIKHERKNLDIVTSTQASNLIFSKLGAEKQCVGVKAKNTTTGEWTEFHAEREVIVSGGAFNSPQLLLLSGIGNSLELRKH